MKEMVNHPDHYNVAGKKECIDEMVDEYGLDNVIMWCILTCEKYRYRCGYKDKEEQELGKIEWYENWIKKNMSCDISYSTFLLMKHYFDKWGDV